MRERRNADLGRLDPGVKRILNPHIYHVSLSEKLWSLKQELIQKEKPFTEEVDYGKIRPERGRDGAL
jgi:hypothetical protein